MFHFEQFSAQAQKEAEANLSAGKSWFFRIGLRTFLATQADFVSGGAEYAVLQAQKRNDAETAAQMEHIMPVSAHLEHELCGTVWGAR